MDRRRPPRGVLPGRFAVLAPFFFTLLALFIALSSTAALAADAAGPVRTFGPNPRPADAGALAAKPAPPAEPLAPQKAAFHLITGFVPISSLPTEDVDLVEVAMGAGPTGVWPTEGAVNFVSLGPGAPFVIASLPTVSPNITGVDFISDGTWGAFASLGFLYLYDVTGLLPVVTATIPLSGTPARRDIDPMLIPHPTPPSGVACVYATGTEIHCVSVPTGALLWTLPLPSPVVEAVDPQINAAGTLLFVPTEGFMTAIDPVAGAILISSPLGSTPLGTTLVREVDARFVDGETKCYLPASGALFVFDGTPPGGGGTGALMATLPLFSPLIEGNDMEVDPSGTFGYLPTLATMYQVHLAGMFYAGSYSFTGFAHQRNHDTVFTPPGVLPAKALYAVQGAVFIYDVAGLFVSGVVATPGTLVDGVDPFVTDSPPFGSIAVLSTLGSTHIINMLTLGVTTLSTPGVLRTDVDPKPAPMLPNRVFQPVIGGLLWAEGFFPFECVVTVSTGLHVVDVAAGLVTEFVSTPGLVYRGGDAQPTTLLAGPPEPPFSVDHPDQDFLTKCWEYKWAMNRWPYWWYYSTWPSDFYPTWTPFAPFGPPALLGYDILNNVKLCILGASFLGPNAVAILDEGGGVIQNIGLPFPAIGGLIWDWDNKICKIRMHNQQEAIINLGPLAWGGAATISFAAYGSRTRWFPVVDRMNGWECAVYAGGRDVWIYDHINNALVTTVTLSARVIRRPVFDDQRKVLCLTLANRRLAYINTWKLRLGYPIAQWLYYSPVLATHVVGLPVFDLYNHHTLVKLWGGRLAVINNDDAVLVWDSGVLPYWPVGPIQIDCYNKIGKGFFRDAANYYEMWCDFYPLVFGGVPILRWLPVPGVPYGYPLFDSKDGYEFYRNDFDRIVYTNLFKPLVGGFITTPFPMIGNLFMDRVNKYALVRLDGGGGGGRLWWMNLHKVTAGLGGAAHVINLPVPAEDDIVFDTQGHYAAVHLQTGEVALIDMEAGTLWGVSGGLPTLRRQLYVHPFRRLINWPWFNGVNGGEVTLDLTPLGWNPPNPPFVNVQNMLAPPVEAEDFAPPPAPIPIEIVQLSLQAGDAPGVIHYEINPLGVEPGSTVQAWNQTRMGTEFMDEPTEAVAEDDGSVQGVSVIALTGDQICFIAYDAAGNASPPTCIIVGPTTGVEPTAVPSAFAFAMSGTNPVRSEASFHYALPRAARVELQIFDLTGRRVTTLVAGEVVAGEHDTPWNLRDADGAPVRAGVYFARLTAGKDHGVERVVVVH